MPDQNYNQIIDDVVEYIKFEQKLKKRMKQFNSAEELEKYDKLDQMVILMSIVNEGQQQVYYGVIKTLFPNIEFLSDQAKISDMEQKTLIEFIKQRTQGNKDYYSSFLVYQAYKQLNQQHKKKLEAGDPLDLISLFYLYFGIVWGIAALVGLIIANQPLLLVSLVLVTLAVAGQFLINILGIIEELYFKERVSENITTLVCLAALAVLATFIVLALPQTLLLFTVPIAVILVSALVSAVRSAMCHFCSSNSLVPGDSRFVIYELEKRETRAELTENVLGDAIAVGPAEAVQQNKTTGTEQENEKALTIELDQLGSKKVPKMVSFALVARCHQTFFNPVHRVIVDSLRTECSPQLGG